MAAVCYGCEGVVT